MDQLETLLRRYRPIGPPPELRDRVIRPRLRWREWLLPTAAAAAAVVFYALTDATRRQFVNGPSADAAREVAVAELTTQLGGDEVARLQAEQVMNEIDALRRVDQDPQWPEPMPGLVP